MISQATENSSAQPSPRTLPSAFLQNFPECVSFRGRPRPPSVEIKLRVGVRNQFPSACPRKNKIAGTRARVSASLNSDSMVGATPLDPGNETDRSRNQERRNASPHDLDNRLNPTS
ncbi:hypothetical protein R1flu_015664 [Riccia fluitans]|uniref:Uncharacterized protein n=1 Tax=Riccia fluitans TaxID=41844 RepID=A0ABD1YJK2_9MARC